MPTGKPPIDVRPATAEDIAKAAEAHGASAIPTMKAWVAEIDGERLAIGGVWFLGGRWVLFVDVTKDGRNLLSKNMYVRAAFVRGAVMVLRESKQVGIRSIYARADLKHPRSSELLLKLGFAFVRAPDLYRWSA